MSNNTIIDAHSHLWARQNTEVGGKRIYSLDGGRAMFMGEVRQMMPPYMTDGRNLAETFIANMNYAQVSAAVIVQEFIDGNQNDYLLNVAQRYPNRFIVSALCDFLHAGFAEEAHQLMERGFRMISIPGHRLQTESGRIALDSAEMMTMFHEMEERDAVLSLMLEPGTTQINEVENVIKACPRLRIAIGHFGMVTQNDWEKQILLARHDNVMIESGGITWLFNDEFYPYPSAVKAIKRAISLVGIEKLMWGSDYPRTMTAITYKMSYDFLDRVSGLTDREKSLFLGENALRFYGIKDPIKIEKIKNMVED